jgi:dihydrodipicolinate synthase/N-acetylneuraminate lyase
MNTAEMSGYLVSVPVAWDQDGLFSPNLFRKAIGKLIQEDCDGLYLFGTSGEGYAVSDDEFTQIVDVYLDATTAFTGFRQVGCLGLSSDQVKHRCRIAAERGLQSVQITLPFWKELNDAEILRYFSDVCGSFPELSFLLYNNPRNKRRLRGKELESIHDVTPNLYGAKTGSGAWLDFFELITESPSLVHFVTEAAFLFSYGLGTVGLIPSSNYVFPQKSRAYYEAVMANDLKTARRLHRDIMRFFYKTATPLVQKGYIDGAIDKAYARIGGMDMPLNIKSPYIPLNNEDFEWLKSVIRMEFADS